MSAVTQEKENKYNDWAVQDAVNTLIRAEEIKKDEKMMKLVDAEAKKQKTALNNITAAKVLFGKKKGNDDESKGN